TINILRVLGMRVPGPRASHPAAWREVEHSGPKEQASHNQHGSYDSNHIRACAARTKEPRLAEGRPRRGPGGARARRDRREQTGRRRRHTLRTVSSPPPVVARRPSATAIDPTAGPPHRQRGRLVRGPERPALQPAGQAFAETARRPPDAG